MTDLLPASARAAADTAAGSAVGSAAGSAASLLVITREPALVEEVARRAAAADVDPVVTGDLAVAMRLWNGAGAVVVGADLAAELVPLGLRRRAGVHLLAWGGVADHLFRTAVALGAEDVSDLPRAGGWLADLLADLHDLDDPEGGRRELARTIGVVGGSGGAGATVFACALAQRAARSGPALVVDADPLGPGLDRILGLERREGVRWPEIGRTSGRLSARALRDAVPRRADLGVLTWSAGAAEPLQAFAVREVLAAAVRGHRTVVLDLPRAGGPVVDEAIARCDCVVLVVVPSVAGLASAARWAAGRDDRDRLRVVVRGGGVPAADVSRALRLPVLATMADQRGLAETVDLGAGPVRSWRGPLGRAAREVLARVTVLGDRA